MPLIVILDLAKMYRMLQFYAEPVEVPLRTKNKHSNFKKKLRPLR